MTGIPTAQLHRLLDALVGEQLRAQPGNLADWLENGLMVGGWFIDMEPDVLATLARIAAGEAYESAPRRTLHAAPLPDIGTVTGCCGRTESELPAGDLTTADLDGCKGRPA